VKNLRGEIPFLEEANLHFAAKGGIVRIGKLRVGKGEKAGPIEFVKSIDLKTGDRFGKWICPKGLSCETMISVTQGFSLDT